MKSSLPAQNNTETMRKRKRETYEATNSILFTRSNRRVRRHPFVEELNLRGLVDFTPLKALGSGTTAHK